MRNIAVEKNRRIIYIYITTYCYNTKLPIVIISRSSDYSTIRVESWEFVEKLQHEGGCSRNSCTRISSLFLSPNRRERLLAVEHVGRDDDVLGPSLQTFEHEDEETVVGIFECTPAYGIETRVMEEEKYRTFAEMAT